MAAALALNLPPDTAAPGVARAAAKRYLGGKLGPERLSELFLVISELVSNALVWAWPGRLPTSTRRGDRSRRSHRRRRRFRARDPRARTGRPQRPRTVLGRSPHQSLGDPRGHDPRLVRACGAVGRIRVATPAAPPGQALSSARLTRWAVSHGRQSRPEACKRRALARYCLEAEAAATG
jgi:two-component sensor histidine kinase